MFIAFQYISASFGKFLRYFGVLLRYFDKILKPFGIMNLVYSNKFAHIIKYLHMYVFICLARFGTFHGFIIYEHFSYFLLDLESSSENNDSFNEDYTPLNEDVEENLNVAYIFNKIWYPKKINEGQNESQSIQNKGGDNFTEESTL